MKMIFYIDMMDRTGAQRVMGILVNYFCVENEVMLINDFPLSNEVKQIYVDSKVRRIFLQRNYKKRRIINNIIRIQKLRKLFIQENPDLIISFLGSPSIRMLIAAVGLHNKKIVSVRNDPEESFGKSSIKRKLINILYKLSDGVVFQTEDASKYFDEDIRKYSTTILNPIDNYFYQVNRSHINNSIVNVGRLEPQKNQFMLIQAFERIAEDYPELRLDIYGSGYLEGELKEYICQHNLQNKIELKGVVDRIEDVLASAKIFVMTSRYEGMPNALMEAMAVGVPSISTDCPCGGPRTLILNDDMGRLVDCDDIEKLIDSLRELLDDEKLLAKISDNAKKRAEAFRADKICTQWKLYFDSVRKGSI